MTAAIYMSRPSDALVAFKPGPKTVWTLVGASAIPLWALWPLFAVVSTGSMPTFQFTTIIFAVGAATLYCLRAAVPGARQSIALRRTKWLAAVMVSFGMLLQNILFILALPYMPAAQANLIVYLWPLMIVVLAALFGLVTLRRLHFLSIALGLAGAALVIGPDMAAGSWTGIGFAVLSGLAWAIFCVFRLWQGSEAPDALANGMALSAIVSLALHLTLETTVMPSSAALMSAILNGMVPLALGNLAWDHGFRRGDRVLLAVMAYATPLVSALILIAFGFAQATTGLLVGGVLIVLGGITSAKR